MRIPPRQSCIVGAILFVVGCGTEVGIPSGQVEGDSEDGGSSATGSSAKNTASTRNKGGNASASRNTGAGGKDGPTTGAGGGSEKGGSDGSGGGNVGKGGSGQNATGGRDGDGWTVSTAKGGRSGTGGKGVGTGGRATGGKAATGGSAPSSTPTITSTCTEGPKTLSNNQVGKHCGYTYEYWKDSGSGSLVLKADGFSIDWSNIGNLLGRKGIRPGTGNEVVTYDSNYQPNGNSYLCIYGWTRNPLIEYYIVDSWGTWRPPGGQGLQGTATCDGGTYDLYKVPRTGPSIDGNGPFTQYFSVRQQKKTSGTITVGCHFAAWKSKGMNMGSMYEVSMTVEGYQSSGKADVKFSMQ